MKKKQRKQLDMNKAFAELEAIVAEFEEGKVDLETSMLKFKRGLELAKFLKGKLKNMKNEIEEIKDKYSALEDDTDLEEVNDLEDLEDAGELPF
ncbi:MAG: exodeoxyribonuclease VII small subunit [Candidatus Woesebacteria bacterium]|jgi:exodeoxyribonuclease VII small subunit